MWTPVEGNDENFITRFLLVSRDAQFSSACDNPLRENTYSKIELIRIISY